MKVLSSWGMFPCVSISERSGLFTSNVTVHNNFISTLKSFLAVNVDDTYSFGLLDSPDGHFPTT